jgi:hypothetical protein
MILGVIDDRTEPAADALQAGDDFGLVEPVENLFELVISPSRAPKLPSRG